LVPDPEAPATDAGMIEFDLDSLSLELENSTPAQEPPAAAEAAPEAPTLDDFDDDQDLQPEDPLATKLALAEEFNAIGDADGARALVEEVIAEATGSLKTKAERLLEQLA
jgi:pilus assembly protein FimV